MTKIDDPLVALAISYAPMVKRPALEALVSLDSALGQVLRATREPMVGQMRLAWWRESLERLDTAPAPAEPVLKSLSKHVVAAGISGAQLAEVVDGWEVLLGDIDAEAVEAHGQKRGASLFRLAGMILDVPDDEPAAAAGVAWALADLSKNLSDADVAAYASGAARSAFAKTIRMRWSRPARPLAALMLVAQRDASGSAPIATVFRLAWLKLTGA